MARPVKEGMDYFSHDTDAVNDEKIEALRMLYGNDGYAFYFILCERIYRTSNFELDISDAETIQILSRKVGVNEEKFNQILQSAIKRKLFDAEAYQERGVLTSNGVKKRAAAIVEKRAAMRDKYRKNKDEVSEAETTQETTPETPQSKVKKSKEKKRKELNYTHEFESFWNLYPRKIGKLSAYKKWCTRLKENVPIETILQATQNYATECTQKKTEQHYIKYPETFLGANKPYEDYLQTPKSAPTYNNGLSQAKVEILEKYRKAGLK